MHFTVTLLAGSQRRLLYCMRNMGFRLIGQRAVGLSKEYEFQIGREKMLRRVLGFTREMRRQLPGHKKPGRPPRGDV